MHETIDSVRTIEHIWIQLADGTRLSARIWLPELASAASPVPAILEYLPYRKNDMTAGRDALMHPYFAQHGYASVRVDARGSGDSDGLLKDEYLPQEQADAVEVITWLSAQPWCTGKVGMIGISWGGFNGLQVAAEAPGPLAGVISIASTDDRYVDDVHYLGGTVNAWDQVSWAATVTGMAALPPSATVRDDWREVWMHRLENLEPLLHAWMEHQTRDEYWKHGSVAEDYSAMKCPIFMVGGWNDAYRDSVFRVLEGYPGQSKGLLGPWAHTWPHQGSPGPAIDFLSHALRWWDFCLKGVENGIDAEPQLQVWMQDSIPAEAGGTDRSGEWAAFQSWPSKNQEYLRYFLTSKNELASDSGTGGTISHMSDLIPTVDRGKWCPGALGVGGKDIPGDQRLEDEKSLTFTGPILEGRQALLGVSELDLRVSADKPNAQLAVRLVDVHPDGSSTLVSRGFLNLTHRGGHERPEAIEPGKWYSVTVPLHSNGYRFEVGHRVRIAVDTAYWPWVWPSPEIAPIKVDLGEASVLSIPLQPQDEVQTIDLGVGKPRFAPPRATEALGEVEPDFRVFQTNESDGTTEILDVLMSSTTRFVDDGLVCGMAGNTRFIVAEGDPLSARIECYREFTHGDTGRPELTRVGVTSAMSATATEFLLTTLVEAFEDDERVYVRDWSRTVPRNHL